LNSERVVQVNIEIMRAFVRLRERVAAGHFDISGILETWKRPIFEFPHALPLPFSAFIIHPFAFILQKDPCHVKAK